MKNTNLFKYATSELSQDAFFIWLCNWANKENENIDKELNSCAKDFIKNVLAKDIKEDIESVERDKQCKNIDIGLLVNNKYFILIEDKTNTNEHSNQLQRYKQEAEEKMKTKKVICIYLKTGAQSKSSLKSIIEKQYKPVMRKELVEFFNKYNSIKNNIFIDFVEYLNDINDKFISFRKENVAKWKWRHWIGFYEELEDEVLRNKESNVRTSLCGEKDILGWKYVSTPSGGFWGFWWRMTKIDDDDTLLYLQIEQGKLCIKIKVSKEDEQEKISIGNHLMDIIRKKSKEDKYKNLHLNQKSIKKKSKTFSKTGCMNVAYTQKVNWIGEEEFSMDKTIEKLKKYIEFIEDLKM